MEQILSFRVEHESMQKRDCSEKTFCFACGCFQGGIRPVPNGDAGNDGK